MGSNEKQLKKMIYSDCRRAMGSPAFFLSITQSATGLLTVFTANILGGFADAVFEMNLAYALSNMKLLLLCIGLSVLALPALDLTGNVVMLKHALMHDRMVLSRFLDKEYEQAMELDAGELQYRLEDDPNSLRIYWVSVLCTSFTLVSTFVFLIYHAVRISWTFTAIMLCVAGVQLIVPIAVKRLAAKYDAAMRQYRAELRAAEAQIIGKPHMVRLYGIKDECIRHFDRIYQGNFESAESKDIGIKAFSQHVTVYLNTVCTLIILMAGAVMVAWGSLTPGAVAAMAGYLAVLHSLFNDLGAVIRQVPILKNLAERMMVFYTCPEDESGEKMETPMELRGDGLAFSYGDKQVFSHLNFVVKQGDKAFICGKNGSGKSTLVKVLCGLLKGYGGGLFVNRKAMSHWDLDSWRRKIAYAQQEPFLFSGSVRENIMIGNQSAPESRAEEIINALGLAHLAEKQISMKTELSGGEKQKISIARALLKDAPILILDEPANHLDGHSLIWLEQFLEHTDQTVLFISHQERFSEKANVRINI